jgi:phosphoenolpyruvate carboxylase
MLAPRDNHLDKSWTIVFQLLHGRLTLDDLAKQIADAALPALQARVDGLLRQLSFQEEQDNEARLRRLLRELAYDQRGLVDFAVFERLLGTELAGIVFTAHPTFSLSEGANDVALELMRASSVGTRSNGGHAQARRVTVHRASAPTLQQEADASTVAIRNLRKALRRVLRVAVEVAAELYPGDYRRLVPRFLTVATWVGFDLDGRTDIGWNRSLTCRYQLALAGLEELHGTLRDMRERHAEPTPGARSP